MRAARLARVSTVHQADNTSIPNQLERTAAYIEAQGWELVATYTDPGESAETLDRPAMNEARRAAKRGEYDILVTYTLDRLTRNIDDLFLLRREFQTIGVKTWAVRDGLDITTADVDDLLGVLFKGYFGHRERETITRRMVEGIERSVKAGRYPGGLPPYGYRIGEGRRLELDDETAPVVKMIFTWVADGMSERAASERLNALQIPSPWAYRGIKSTRRDGVKQTPVWKASTVRNIIRAETYVGRWVYGKTGDTIPEIVVEVPPIVDQTTWDKAQATAEANRQYKRPAKTPYLLRGLIRCADCGAAYCGRPPRRKGGPHAYRCGGRYHWEHLGEDRRCTSITVNGRELEAVIWADCEEFIRQPHLVAAELNKHRTPAQDGITAQLAHVDRQIAEREAELDRCLGLYTRGTIPLDRLDTKAEEIRGALVTLRAYRERLTEEQRRADLWERETSGIVEALTALQEQLDAGLDFATKRAIAQTLVKSIMIETPTDDDGKPYSKAHVTYRFEQPSPEIPLPIELAPIFQQWRHIDEFSILL
jgi:site-specific DNA recombinase